MTRSSGRAFEWSLASVALGATLTVAAPPGLLASEAIAGIATTHLARFGIAPAAALAPGVGLHLLSLAGVVAGCRGVALAGQSGRPITVALAGILLSAAAAAFWAGVGGVCYNWSVNTGPTRFWDP